MTSNHYKVIYQQQLREGFTPERIKAPLASLLKLSEDQAEKLLSMRQAVIRQNIDLATAKQYQQALYKRGLVTVIDLPAAAKKPTIAPSQINKEPELSVQHLASPVVSQTEPPKPPPPPIYASRDQIDGESRTIPFEFSGNGSEYFNIWIVNIVLSILTLGIYSAWAKVRNKQYFYGNTTLDGASFEYTAKPITILKGRLVAFVFVAIYYALTSFAPPQYVFHIYGVFALIFIGLLPWIVVKGLQFNARHSRYRNIAFRFGGSYKEAFSAFILWPLAGLLFFFLPFSWHRKARFFINNSGYGTESFEFNASVRDYYHIFGMLVAMGFTAALVGAGALFLPWIPLLNIIIYALMMAYFVSQTTNLMYSSTLLKTYGFDAQYDTRSYAWLMVTNTVGIVLTLGLYTPWAHVRTAHYKAQHISLVATESLNHFHAGEQEKINALGEGFADSHDLFDIDVGV